MARFNLFKKGAKRKAKKARDKHLRNLSILKEEIQEHISFAEEAGDEFDEIDGLTRDLQALEWALPILEYRTSKKEEKERPNPFEGKENLLKERLAEARADGPA